MRHRSKFTFPHCCKKATIRPLLKKPNLDPNDVASYRPISNLSFLSKVGEKVVDVRLSDHMNRHHLLPFFQSAYRPNHTTETALARIMNDMILVVDDGRVGAFTLLDLSAAFDTVDHSVLTNVLRKRFGVSGKALGWVEEYMRDRSQAVRVNSNETPSVWPHLCCGTGHEKRRGEQLKWSVAGCTSEVFQVLSYQDQFIQPGWAECVFYI